MSDLGNQIFEVATARFMSLGIKSVSMDDLARIMGISKKTLYQFFENKEDLVNQAIVRHIDLERQHISELIDLATDAVHEMVEVSRHAVRMFRSIKPALLYDLQKYYRSCWHEISEFHEGFIRTTIKDNLKRGMEEGYYRDDIDAEIISKLYVMKSYSLVDETAFPLGEYQRETLLKQHVMYHLYGILSKKGQAHLDDFKIFE